MIDETAVYKGKEYDATLMSDSAWLRSMSSEDLELGFELEDGVYYKKVPLSELDAAYKMTTFAVIDGVRHFIMGENERSVIVSFSENNTSLETRMKYGLHTQYDRGSYERSFSKYGLEIETVREEIDLSKYKS